MENTETIHSIVVSIRRLYRAVYLDVSKTSRSYGVTGSQSGVLRTLQKHGPMSSAQLSRKLFMTPSNITGIIDRLEKKDLVQRIRKKGDRRVTLITLTDSGRELSSHLPDPIETKLIYGLVDLDSDQVMALHDALNKLLSLIDAKGITDVPLE